LTIYKQLPYLLTTGVLVDTEVSYPLELESIVLLGPGNALVHHGSVDDCEGVVIDVGKVSSWHFIRILNVLVVEPET